MNDPIRPAVDLAVQLCGCANVEQRKRDTAIIEADRAAIRADERANIVAWLRDAHDGRLVSRAFLADAIERGDHTGGGDGAD